MTDNPNAGVKEAPFIAMLENELGHVVVNKAALANYAAYNGNPGVLPDPATYDIIVFTECTNSANYADASGTNYVKQKAWNALAKPIVIMNYGCTWSSRWGLVNTTGNSGALTTTCLDTPIASPSHPFVIGRTGSLYLPAHTTYTSDKGALAADVKGTIVAKIGYYAAIIDIPTGTAAFNNKGTTGERRAFFQIWDYSSGAASIVFADMTVNGKLIVGQIIDTLAPPATPVVTGFSVADASDGNRYVTDAAAVTVSLQAVSKPGGAALTHYMIRESNTPPAADDPNWQAMPLPTTYTFAAEGTYTLYAWVKDGDGNVSPSRLTSKSNTIVYAAAPPAPEVFIIAADNYGGIYHAKSNGDGTFSGYKGLTAVSSYSEGAVAIADFDNDGALEFIIGYANNTTTASYYYFENTGGGTFASRGVVFTLRNVNKWAMGCAAGDFNNDGNIDVVANGNSTTLALYLGNGDGTFSSGSTLYGYSDAGRAISTGDFNFDGNLDFARTAYPDGYVRLYLGDGAGHFTSTIAGDAGSNPYGTAAGDFDGDGCLDVIAGGASDGDCFFLKGKPDGTFFPQAAVPSLDFNESSAYATYDFNADGKLDMVFTKYTSRQIWFAPGNGNGSFGTPVQIGTSNTTNDVLGVAAPPANYPFGAPRAVVSPKNTTIVVGGTVNFSGAASRDPNGNIVQYDWDFGDGATGAGATIGHAYTSEGVRHGMLKVTDDSGVPAYAAFTVTVRGNTPVAEANGPYTFGEQYMQNGAWTVSLDGTGSSDAETAAGLLKYAWDFGDGFSDDFSDGNDSGWGRERGTWTEADGVYAQSYTTADYTPNLFIAGGELADFTAEVDVTMLSANQHAYIYFRAKDFTNSYSFLLRGSGYDDVYIQRRIMDNWTTLVTRPVPFTVVNGKTYHLAVVCQGSNMKAYVNGDLVAEADDTFFASGYVGLGTYGTVARFDNFVVTSAPVAGKTPTHTYRKGPATYNVALKVTDSAGQTGTDTTTVKLEYNDPPVAEAGGPYAVTEATAYGGLWQVQLDGSGSTDDVQIVDYCWAVDADSFTGATLDSRWLTGGATQNDEVTLAGTGTWGQRYLFDKRLVTRTPAAVARQARVKIASGTHDIMVGFKDTSTNYAYQAMTYAMYFYSGYAAVYIYEDGTSRGATSYPYPLDTWFEVRIELKNGAGARYYYRLSGAAGWTLLYDSNYSMAGELMAGATVSRGTITLDDYRATIHGRKPVAFYYAPDVYPVELTVTDRAGQTGSDLSTVTVTQGNPPVANAGPDVNLGEAEVVNGTWTVLLDGSASTDDFGIYRYEWDFGDGKPVAPQSAITHVYNAPGTYIATLTVWDNALQSSSDTKVITIVPGAKPVANAGPDRTLGELDAMWGTWTILFDGSKSTDDYWVQRYEWDFGDGTTGSGQTVSHTYSATGVYTVTLVVYDEIPQASDPDTLTVTINAGTPPVANAGGPYEVPEEEVASGTAYLLFDGSGSTDDAPMLRYIWDFGLETFDGAYFDKRAWDYSSGVYVNIYGDYLAIWGESWGNKYLCTSHAFRKRPGLVAQATLCEAGNTMFGFKNSNNTSYSYTQFTYALYLNSGNLLIYEDGTSRGDTGFDYPSNTWYDFKVEIDDDGGASYYCKATSATTWTRVYKSTYVAGSLLKPGLVVNDNYCQIDNFRLMASGEQVVFPIRREGQVTLTVEDQAHQKNSQTVPIRVIGSNGPVANPGGPYFSTFELPTKLDGSHSSDDRGVVKYLWYFGDGTPLGSGPTPIHAYAVGTNTGPVTKTVTLTVVDAAGHTDTKSTTVTLATGPLVTCVPWQISGGVEVPHRTWSGKSIRLKGVVRGGIGALSYTWKFGDGSADATGTVPSKYAIEASHTYTASDGATFTATLTVKDSQNNSHSDTYPIVVLPAGLDTKVDVAIDEGLWWLHKNQYRDTASFSDGRWRSYSSYDSSSTGSAIQAFFINGHRETGEDTEDPYVETVRRGMAFNLRNLISLGIGYQAYGDPDFPYDGTGNGLGLAAWSDRQPYEGGMIMDGIVAGATPNRTACFGAEANVIGRTYREILQDLIDAYAYGQYDDASVGGGWRYGWNQGPDNSACQWAAIGMIPSTQAPWYCVVPQWVRQRNDVWLYYSYDATNRLFGYTASTNTNNSGHATRPSGMVQMVMSVDNYKFDSRWVATEAWFTNTSNWNWFISSGYYNYGWYAFVKAMRLSKTETLSNGYDWFRGTSGIAELLTGLQNADGGWPDKEFGRIFDSAWGVIMLTPSLFELPPVAEAGPDIVWGYDVPLTFDGSASYHLDPTKQIVWYEWDFDGDGTYDYGGENPVAVHTFAFDSGLTYPVTYRSLLRVRDNLGATDTDTRQVVIAQPPHAPYAVITGPRIVEGAGVATAGLPATLDATQSYDIDPGDIITRYEWDFDGSNGYDFDNPQSTDPITTYTWASPGVYHIGLRVWDNGVMNPPDNAPLPSVPAYLVINVEANRAPVAEAGGPYTIYEGQPLTFINTSYDPNLAGDPLSYAWDLDGDGQYDDSTDKNPTWTWNDNGTYTVGLRVSDGLLSATDTAIVTVNDLGPTAVFSWSPQTPSEGAPASFTDQSTSPGDQIVAWSWDFAGLGTSALANPTFAFPDKGVYTVTLTVTDDDGSTDSVSHGVTVQAVGPTARNDTATVLAYSGPNPINVLANDTYLPGPPEVLRIVAKTNGAHGTVVITGGGTGLTYQPAPTYTGSDSFTYTISDEDGLTSTASVAVTVRSAPVPGDVNGDGCVNVADLLYVRNNLGKTHQQAPAADMVGDNDGVNVADLLYVRNKMGTGTCK